MARILGVRSIQWWTISEKNKRKEKEMKWRIRKKRMKSIKEKSNEYAKEYLFNPLPQRAPNIHFEAGANYVLEKFVDIVNKNTKPNGMEDRAQMASDMLILIAQLKK